MKIQYFPDTDTVYMQLNNNSVVETRGLDENTIIDVDARGNLVGITIEHAKERADITNFMFQQVATPVAA